MGRENRKRTFSTAFLRQLTTEDNSCVELKRDKLHMAVHPFQLKEFTSSLQDVLSRRVARFNKELGGILLGYDNIALQSGSGALQRDHCYVHVDVEGDFYVFRPEIGRLLKGVVNKKSRSHVGALVYELFNVALPSPEEEEEEGWLGDGVAVGQEVVFRIVDTNLKRKLPYIRGEIVSVLTDSDSGISTGEERRLADSSEDEKPAKKKKQRHKENQIETNYTEQETSPKKRKRKKHLDYSQANEDEEEITTQETPKSKKEKRSSLKVADDEEIEVPKKHKKKKHTEAEEQCVEKNETTGSKKRKHESMENEEEAGISASVSPKKKKRKRADSD